MDHSSDEESKSSPVRKTKKQTEARPPITNLKNYIISTNVLNMCVPLKKALCPDMYHELKEENLFPYVECTGDGKCGFFFKQLLDGKEVYSSLTNAEWRSILNGKKLRMRPNSLEKVKAIQNRVEVKTSAGTVLRVGYWPDAFYQERLNTASKAQRKREKKDDTSGDARTEHDEAPVSKKHTGPNEPKKPAKDRNTSATAQKKKVLSDALSSENDGRALEGATGTDVFAYTSFSSIVPTTVDRALIGSSKSVNAIFEDPRVQETFREFALAQLLDISPPTSPREDLNDELENLLQSESDKDEEQSEEPILTQLSYPKAPVINGKEIHGAAQKKVVNPKVVDLLLKEGGNPVVQKKEPAPAVPEGKKAEVTVPPKSPKKAPPAKKEPVPAVPEVKKAEVTVPPKSPKKAPPAKEKVDDLSTPLSKTEAKSSKKDKRNAADKFLSKKRKHAVETAEPPTKRQKTAVTESKPEQLSELDKLLRQFSGQ